MGRETANGDGPDAAYDRQVFGAGVDGARRRTRRTNGLPVSDDPAGDGLADARQRRKLPPGGRIGIERMSYGWPILRYRLKQAMRGYGGQRRGPQQDYRPGRASARHHRFIGEGQQFLMCGASKHHDERRRATNRKHAAPNEGGIACALQPLRALTALVQHPCHDFVLMAPDG